MKNSFKAKMAAAALLTTAMSAHGQQAVDPSVPAEVARVTTLTIAGERATLIVTMNAKDAAATDRGFRSIGGTNTMLAVGDAEPIPGFASWRGNVRFAAQDMLGHQWQDPVKVRLSLDPDPSSRPTLDDMFTEQPALRMTCATGKPQYSTETQQPHEPRSFTMTVNCYDVRL